MNTWHELDDGRQICETSDPRLILVIEPEADSHLPDGDAFAPAYWLDDFNPRRRRTRDMHTAGSPYDEEYTAQDFGSALERFGDRDQAERYMRIFHDTEVRYVEVYRGSEVVILDTPGHRKHVGAPPRAKFSTEDYLTGDLSTWRAIRDGEVYGVGYAVNLDRLEASVEIDDKLAGWDVEILCWGHHGEEYARSTAEEEAYGAPKLPALLF